MPISRRNLLKAGAAAGALLMAQPVGALARGLGPSPEFATDRGSRLFPHGTRLAHADLHNHTHLSDGAGDPMNAFESMRSAGLDVAALTDHATLSWGAVGVADPCSAIDNPTDGQRSDCQSVVGLDEAGWELTRELADAANDPDAFTAIRGFEWTSPILGHINVWFSSRWIDPLHTAGVGPAGFGQHLHQNMPGIGPALQPAVDTVLRTNPARVGMELFYRWLNESPDTPVLGGGLDGIAGFNHPGREPGRFEYFAYSAAVRERIVSMEILNRRDDYLFEGYFDGQPSPLVECLNAGWRVGLLGVTDEHGNDWGYPDGKGRAGLWVPELTRDGVRTAMENRHFYATNLRGLRLDAAARVGTAPPIRMGGVLDHASGPVTFTLDVDRGPEWADQPLEIQVLRPGTEFPEVVHVEEVRAGSGDTSIIRFTVPLDAADGDWVVLRVADPTGTNNQLGPDGHPCNNLAIAYASPFWLEPSSA
jgi:hypothetical protein